MLARIYYCGCGSLSQIAGNDLGSGRHERWCTNSHPLPSLACLPSILLRFPIGLFFSNKTRYQSITYTVKNAIMLLLTRYRFLITKSYDHIFAKNVLNKLNKKFECVFVPLRFVPVTIIHNIFLFF